ncbi:hypothetical protein HMI55_001013 [Coelomomyces lativittatus]|nr:hypothetical protein HMI55_001013 [Coelomomyces lativittatus]
MQVNPVDLAASHQAMMKSLLFKPVPVPPSQLWEMVSNMGLSRDVSEPMNFGDGLLIAEIIHLHSSLLVPSPVLQKLELEARHYPNQRKVWDQLARKNYRCLCVFRKENSFFSMHVKEELLTFFFELK